MGHRGGPGVDCRCGQRRQLPAAGRGARAASRRHPQAVNHRNPPQRSPTGGQDTSHRRKGGAPATPHGVRRSRAPSTPHTARRPATPDGDPCTAPRQGAAARCTAEGQRPAAPAGRPLRGQARRGPAGAPAPAAGSATSSRRSPHRQTAGRASYDRGRAQQTSGAVTGGRWVTAGEVHRQLWTSAEVGRGCGVGGGSPSGATPVGCGRAGSAGAGWVGGWVAVAGARRGVGVVFVGGGCGGCGCWCAERGRRGGAAL